MGASPKIGAKSTRAKAASKKSVAVTPAQAPAAGKTPASKNVAVARPSIRAPRAARAKPATQATPANHPPAGLLGTIVAPSGTLTVIDIGLLEYMELATLQPGLLAIAVPPTPLQVMGETNGRSGNAATWQRIKIVVGPEPSNAAPSAIAASRLVGHVPIDLAQLAAIDAVTLSGWQHEASADGKADVIFWGKDAAGLAALLAAPSHRDGYGWCDVPLARAEQFADKIAVKKHDHHWQVSVQIRPHSDYFGLAEVARASATRTGSAAVGNGTAWLGLSMPTGAFPVFIDEDASGRLVQVRIEFSAEARF
ncbi:MAG: hypothetical protein KBG15_04490 [Kofleriaceae bacterium]|nr:hypothetical protein [Kofleriaceae bacterium]